MLRHVVVILPGLGGSVLQTVDGAPTWDLTPGHLGHALVDPASLDIGRELVPATLVDTMTVFGPWWSVPGYDGLTHHLRTRFGRSLRMVDVRPGAAVPPDVDVVRVPYDFRRSIADAAEEVGRAVTAAVGDSGRQVVVVAHSMGGLVARYWIGACDGWRHTRALITLGTPHRGAPRALDWLFNGAGMGLLRLPKITEVLRSWPGVYELLPQYPAVLRDGTAVEVFELLAENVRRLGDRDAPTRVLRGVADAARVHRDVDEGWRRIPPDRVLGFLPFFGRGHATLGHAEVRGRRVRVAKRDAEWRGNVGWRGDGTVPALAAIPREFSAEPERAQAIGDKHGAMGSTAAILDVLATLQGADLPVRGGTRPLMPWLGWDVEETVPAGAAVEVGAEVQPGEAGPSEVAGSAATLVVSGGAAPLPVPMAAAGPGWRAVLPPMPAGAYQLDIEVKDAWHGTSVYATTPLSVIEPPTDAVPDERE
jgi:hypothetical protein